MSFLGRLFGTKPVEAPDPTELREQLFDAVANGYGALARRIVHLSVVMLLLYAGVIAFGLNEFRKTPVGFIPQQDQGYLIVALQLPDASSIDRTDAVNRRAVELALDTPGVAHAVNLVGFSGATRTNAPNAGAVFVVLKPFEERAKDPRMSAQASAATSNGS